VTIVGGRFKDKNDKIILANDVIEAIEKNIKGPIYTNDELYLNAGILGACIFSIEDSIKEVVDTIIENINDRPINEIPITYEQYYNNYIDYISVFLNKRYLMNTSESGVFIHNSLEDIYNMIKKQPAYKVAMCVLFVIICMFVYFIEYIFNLKRKKKTERLILEERKKVKSDYVALVNHEFRTPINIILNSSNLIRRNINNEEYVFDRLEGIDNNSYRLYRLINNLLYIINIESGLEKLKLKSTNVVEVIEEAVQEAVKYANKKI